LRAQDALAHQPGTDRFAVAMLALARGGRPPQSADARAALARIATAISLATGRRLQTGWQQLQARAEIASLPAALDVALERGSRERERNEMLATVGHELRTPLTSIRGYVETLLEGELDAATARRFLETVRREALRMGRMVEGMLEFSMLDLSPRRNDARCDVAQQVRAALEVAEPLANQRRTAIRAHVPTSVYARVDGDACVHAVLNVVENAVNCSPSGATIEVSCLLDGRFVCVRVDDDGPGISPAERESIFAMGVRGVAASHPGAGIGLAVVRAIAEGAGGDVRVLPSTLGGARFEIRLPAD
jgi:signal transduction histidine kinase